MSLPARLRYALYLAAVSGVAINGFVAIASADAIALLSISAFEALFNPFFLPTLYAASFLLSPWVAERLPIKRRES